MLDPDNDLDTAFIKNVAEIRVAVEQVADAASETRDLLQSSIERQIDFNDTLVMILKELQRRRD